MKVIIQVLCGVLEIPEKVAFSVLHVSISNCRANKVSRISTLFAVARNILCTNN